jgi:hypothetical protein
MTYGELSNFTYEELSGLTYGELQKTPRELIAQIETYGSQIPYDTYSKLLKICSDINESLVKHNIEPLDVPKNDPEHLKTLIKVLLYLMLNHKSLEESFKEIFDRIFDVFF